MRLFSRSEARSGLARSHEDMLDFLEKHVFPL